MSSSGWIVKLAFQKYLSQFRFIHKSRCHTSSFLHTFSLHLNLVSYSTHVVSQYNFCHKFGVCHSLSYVTKWILLQLGLCYHLSFVTGWVLSQVEFCHNLSCVTIWVLSQLVFCHNLDFSQLQFCHTLSVGII